MRRRDLFRATLSLAGLAGATHLGGVRTARAFGEVPAGYPALLPADRQAFNVLELYLFGGVSQYESFLNTTDGEAAGTHWYQFYNSGDVDAALDSCGYSGGSLVEPFGEDGQGKRINFGPFAKPLRDRADIMARTRVCLSSHSAEPHEVAVPLALSGRPPGHPTMAGTGSHVQRYFTQLNGAGALPYSYVLRSPSAIQTELTRVAVATGLHPGTVRPLSLNVADASALKLLERAGVSGHREAFDAMVATNMARYGERLKWGAQGELLRAPRYVDAAVVAEAKGRSAALAGALEDGFFQPDPVTLCEQSLASNPTRNSLKLAAHLLTLEEGTARYVAVIDGGLVPVSTSAGGYDSHEDNPMIQAENLFNVLQALADVVATPGNPEPGKIDLDRTMIVINTEFGRTPFEQGRKGRGHWPFGYPVLYIGGPVRDAQRGVHGVLESDGTASAFTTPQENRIAVLLALGIYPFNTESFNVGDVVAAATEDGAARQVLQNNLGIVL